ncbi:hypothetical protein DNK34_16310 [Pseudomonas dryadis]|uniref:Uncharacterized protein n=1 Tax=Phytopseudomonas dryadis TaxID=2487520 RepID=A0A4Q9R770_9GAMM|nr:hypothetical protein DNK44_04635 [Pseudomonas dryadis]TBV03502.1 hypothetical protein DNK34_16310 [Pseudomonas dryadis]TBV16554.1 hypothetical protein DNK41_14715 [Pseudomonas sp. FRB 230]
MAFPFQVLQRSMARFPAQPEGPGPFCRNAAFLADSFSPLNFAARALPRGKTGSGAAVRETATDPNANPSYLKWVGLLILPP